MWCFYLILISSLHIVSNLFVVTIEQCLSEEGGPSHGVLIGRRNNVLAILQLELLLNATRDLQELISDHWSFIIIHLLLVGN